ncbi:MAG TPA: peptidase domain-containing ABC transporter [Bacteroidales bacterium]|nr:peptidase domain-containing ABC transporter [Bacteroidales bacterium]HNT93434.1 peptidase domain-containing ABC transporter [Bacteroidales bacterium]HOO65870.1 peptidase domain-containing ABC transporter [Bacteroidales bacterium]HPJ04685.1 peptidase domain-containing ABC transporter [Bacteroidales bacterium]HPQ63356.1 peptidase domain-containing ABC transporter [Bacteroidales bacterium]
MAYPFVRQYDAMDCGPACLSMVALSHGRRLSLETIRKRAWITREGVSFLGLKSAAESIGFKAAGVKIPFGRLKDEAPMPCIVHWKQNHFIVVNRVNDRMVWVSDPAIGRLKLTHEEFRRGWISGETGDEPAGMALLLEPGPAFLDLADDPPPTGGFRFLAPYLKPYRKQIVMLTAGLIISSGIQLLFPFMTQAIIDRGIANSDIRFIYLILAGQLALTAGRLSVEFFRGWLLLHLGSRLNIRIVSDFLARLMGLPIAYFDTRLNGDILQRIDDNSRIEGYLTSSSLAILFSLFNFVVFGVVLGIYSIPVLLVFLGGTALYIIYVTLFMPARERLDNVRFMQMAEAGDRMINIVNGMQEIKLAGNEASNRREWERMQQEIYGTRVKGLRILQFQTAGGTLIHESVNIIITVISATLVINNSMTLGMMLAVQFITGQLNGPVSQIVNFMRATQDARISLERLAEVHAMEPEEKSGDEAGELMPERADIIIKNLSFRYEGPGSPWVLHNLNMIIPAGKITAVVGESGSGKTTLLKMIMGFYPPAEGSVTIGGKRLEDISISSLRKNTGAVMQEGYIFPDTILGNIAPGEDDPDMERVAMAVSVASLNHLLSKLPSGLSTKIGQGGHGLSQGQRQRILIARVVYKQPSLLLLDEATSSLDASNERMIVENLAGFYAGRTVVIVAHRLSTVRHADMIAVLEGGEVTETGTHAELTALKGKYYRLIRDQLELGT